MLDVVIEIAVITLILSLVIKMFWDGKNEKWEDIY